MNKFDKSRYNQLKMFETKNIIKKDAFQEQNKNNKKHFINLAVHPK